MRKIAVLALLLAGCLGQRREGQAKAGTAAVADVAGADVAVGVGDATYGIKDSTGAPLVLGISVNGVGVPGFAADKLSYALKVGIGTQTASVTVDAPEGVTLTVNGQAAQAGQPSPAAALNLGAHVFTVTATAAGQTQVYTLTVTRGLAGQEAYFHDTSVSNWFMMNVAIAGNTLVVGTPWEANNSVVGGAAYIFVRNGTTWSQQAYLQPPNVVDSDRFGWSVAIDGDTAVVSAPGETSSAGDILGQGAAYVFVRQGKVWSPQDHLKASNTGTGDFFGDSVAIAGDTIVVGASGEWSKATGINGDQGDNSAPGSGAAYVFVRSGTVWSQQAYLKASNTDGGDGFGHSVAIDGDTVVVGAITEESTATGIDGNQADNSAPDSGAAYVFVRDGKVWSQQAYLKASNTDPHDSFGTGVAISGNTVVVGASMESSKATGIDGAQGDNSAPYSGAAYVFVRNGKVWSQQAYLKASNTDAIDEFGWSVAIAGEVVVVGTIGEDAQAIGINGDEGDNSAPFSGGAYVFARSGTVWSQQAYLKASNNQAYYGFGVSVAAAGDTVVVGASVVDSASGQPGGGYEPFQSGAIYVFR